MNPIQQSLILAVRLYRWTVSPAKAFLFGPACGCRFEPSCSAYAIEALHRHGALAGSWLALKRICRCHPWGGCGPDPVPGRKTENRKPQSEIQNPGNSLVGVAGAETISAFRVPRSALEG